MSRFRPRSSRPGRLWPWLILWFVLVIAYLIWVGWPRSAAVGATIDKAVTRSTHNLSVSYTGQLWHNKPIYVLSNHGAALEHVVVYNLSEDMLPVLYVGVSAPQNLEAAVALAHPPYSVAQQENLWFVSSALPPTMFTVTWDEQGKTLYTTVKVKNSIPSTTFTRTLASKGGMNSLIRAATFDWQPPGFVVH